MDPTLIKQWGDLISIPVILIVIVWGIWRLFGYFGKNFITPLGGTDGKIAKFFESTSAALEKMPETVTALKNTIAQGTVDQTHTLNTLTELHKTSSHQCDIICDLLKDILKGKQLTSEMLTELGAKHDLDFKTKLTELRILISKWENTLK